MGDVYKQTIPVQGGKSIAEVAGSTLGAPGKCALEERVIGQNLDRWIGRHRERAVFEAKGPHLYMY